MTIAVFKDYKIFDAGSKSGIESIIGQLAITESNVILNLSNCIIDYPATSKIIDKIISDLQMHMTPRSLVIQTHLNITELLLLHWLFIGSNIFQIDDSKKKTTVNDFKKIIDSALKKRKTKVTIEIKSKEGRLIKTYNYGLN